jgi:hypothetical protein
MVKLYDAAGRLVSRKILSNNQETVPMKDLAPGIYLLCITKGGTTISLQKIVHE